MGLQRGDKFAARLGATHGKAKCPNYIVLSNKRSLGSAAMRGRSRAAATGRTIWCRTPLCARWRKLIYGRRELISVPGYSPSCTTSTSTPCGAIREQRTVDIEGLSSSLVATTDPTASRQLRELECALARLRGEQREVVLLVGLEGMSYETVAKVLAVPIGTVRSRLSRAREALRQFMDMNGDAKSASGARQRRPALAGDVAA